MQGLLYLALAILKLMLPMNCHSLGEDTLERGASLHANHTIKSKNGTFELGFFSPNQTNNWYIGIWYAQISENTTVWVANRNAAIRNAPGVLNLSTDGNLRLFDLEGRLIWWTDSIQKGCRAVILDSGNFVMLGGDNSFEIVWESFGHPTDTWLPGIKQWQGLRLISWKSSSDPAPGPFSFQMQSSREKKQILLVYNNSIPYWYSGKWTGDHFSDLPELLDQKMINMSFGSGCGSKIYFIFMLNPKMLTAKARLVLHKDGQLRMCFWVDKSRWNCVWSAPRDQCDAYAICGAYGACNSNNIHFCSCLHGGFTPKHNRAWDSQDWWSSGCVRRSPLQCSVINGITTDVFLQVTDKSLPAEQAVLYPKQVTRQGCEAACLKNCSCTAFAIGFSTPPICQLWFGDLFNARDSSDGQSVFIRLAASELPETSSTPSRRAPALNILLPAIAAFIAVFAMLFAVFVRCRRRRLLRKSTERDEVPTLLRTFAYKELQIATENFKHKLGSGAFGTVFKGSLADNTLVAVKKLEGSAHAEKQFRAEISTIGSLQHVNLVRLRGFCAEKSRRLLVYEYMPNGSLDSLLFHGVEGGKVLEWKTRFQIALGTARGLVYLHEECRDRIIHCDIKPENILLDAEFCPKVADFGMAKLLGRDFSSVLTTARGTRGYLAPEWIYGLPITPKVDVYSFGMTLLEIISGRRNLDLNVESSRIFFATWAASEVEKGNIAGIVDRRISEKADMEEVRRAVVVGQLCIQEEEDARPSMAQVLQILEGKMDADTQQVKRCPELVVDPKLFLVEVGDDL